MTWPFKSPQEVPLQQEFVSSNITRVRSFSVNTSIVGIALASRKARGRVRLEAACASRGAVRILRLFSCVRANFFVF